MMRTTADGWHGAQQAVNCVRSCSCYWAGSPKAETSWRGCRAVSTTTGRLAPGHSAPPAPQRRLQPDAIPFEPLGDGPGQGDHSASASIHVSQTGPVADTPAMQHSAHILQLHNYRWDTNACLQRGLAVCPRRCVDTIPSGYCSYPRLVSAPPYLSTWYGVLASAPATWAARHPPRGSSGVSGLPCWLDDLHCWALFLSGFVNLFAAGLLTAGAAEHTVLA